VTSQAWFVNGDVDVSLGSTIVERIVVVNDGDQEETYRLTPVGLAAGWATLRPSTVTVGPGTQEDVEVEIRPPRLATTAAGATGLTVRVAPQRPDTEPLEATIALDVQPVRDRRLSLLQPAQRGRLGANYELTLENRGNVQASCRLRLVDITGRLEAEFQPPAVGVEPGGTALVRARMRTTERQWERRRRTLPFRVDAEQQGAPTVSASGTLVQTPMLPERLWSWVIGIVAVLALLAAGWFALAKPAIRDAADDAVAERLDTTVPTSVVAPATTLSPTTTSIASTSTAPPTTATAPTVTTPAGDPFVATLAAKVALGQFGEAPYTVPDGTVLRITDVVVQNPSGDFGQATMAVDDQNLLSWSLEFVASTAAVPLTSPIEVHAGSVVHFVVTCVQVGPTTTTPGSCSPALFLSGRQLAG
jgi:hypothetical protein